MLIKAIKLFIKYDSELCSVRKSERTLGDKKLLFIAIKQRWIWWTDKIGLIKNNRRTDPIIDLGFSPKDVHDNFGYTWYSRDYLDDYVLSYFNFYSELGEQK